VGGCLKGWHKGLLGSLIKSIFEQLKLRLTHFKPARLQTFYLLSSLLSNQLLSRLLSQLLSSQPAIEPGIEPASYQASQLSSQSAIE